jgi:glucosamine--fructose-6-phosphate aminotransferase (isomerizing)
MSRHLADAPTTAEAFRRTVSAFEGSVAIGAAVADSPSTLYLALRGSGQGLYIGLADDCYIVASEPYGVVEETSRYVRMDGESGGEIVVLDGASAGELEGIVRLAYDGGDLPVSDDDVVTAEVTTRDIDRGDAPHFLLKEISEAPNSFGKTLRGKIVDGDGLLHAVVGDRALPVEIAARLADGTITRVRVIGQGTAAVAGQSTAAILDELTESGLDVDGHHDRHEPHGRPAAVARCGGAGHRQPAGERPHRQGRRCDVHVRRSRRRDERCVDEGLLLAGGGGRVAVVRDRRSVWSR